MHVATIKFSNYGGQESKKQFAIYDSSDTPVTFKQGRDHQTWYELVDPKHGYNHASLKDHLKLCPRKCQWQSFC